MLDENVKDEVKIVIHPGVARRLLKKGYRIVDIKPRRENCSATVFVFKVENNFLEDFLLESEDIKAKDRAGKDDQ